MSNDASTWRELLDETSSVVGDRTEARWLCEEAAGLYGDDFRVALDTAASQRMGLALQAMVGRRLAGEPLQYVLGHWPFRHIDLLVDRRVLIPRPETEVVAETALSFARQFHTMREGGPVRIADLGTGSGAIGLSIASEMPVSGVEVWITDASSDALDVARANIAGIGRNATNVRVALGHWCAALPDELRGDFHVIVANPPYIADDDTEIDDSVLANEPHGALFAKDNGLADIFEIASQARDWLVSNGRVVLEIGHRQGAAVSAELTSLGYGDIEIRTDLAGRDRIATAIFR